MFVQTLIFENIRLNKYDGNCQTLDVSGRGSESHNFIGENFNELTYQDKG